MTNTNSQKAALVTGATSGLGFEAAAQLADAGYGRITITGRNADKAEAARAKLVARTGRDAFDTLVLDLGTPKSVSTAVEELVRRGRKTDFLLLNAGMVGGNDLIRTDEGIEVTHASSLVGHHQLTMQMLEDNLLCEHARIVIAGSEAARGDVPTFNPVDLPAFAAEHHEGDMVAAADSVMRAAPHVKYKPSHTYANAKLFVAYWAAELARKLPTGMTVNAVSPGSAPDTNAGRNAPFFLKRVMVPIFKLVPGMSAPVSEAAARYLEAADFPEQVTGQFYASAPKKMTGPLHRVELPHVHDQTSQKAVWGAIVAVAGGMDYPVAA